MRLRSTLIFSLLAMVLLVGCAPAEAPDVAQPDVPAEPTQNQNEPAVPSPTVSSPLAETAPTEAPPTGLPPTEAPTEVPQIVATSRGPDLHATNPATVSLASGELQLVEFFRYT